MRLIDADALIECIRDDLYNSYKDDHWYRLIANALIKCINEQPTINARPDRCPKCGYPLEWIAAWSVEDNYIADCKICGATWWIGEKGLENLEMRKG